MVRSVPAIGAGMAFAGQVRVPDQGVGVVSGLRPRRVAEEWKAKQRRGKVK
jgi:hypothetical protein